MGTIETLLREKLVAVIRAESEEQGFKLAQAIIEGGFKAIEITFTVPNASALISKLKDTYHEEIFLGAGTVLDLETCKIAIDSGATFIVSPGFDEACAKYCYVKGIPYMPGCMTVTEIMNALNNHVQIIKLFPGDHFGSKFIKNIKAPLPNVKVMVTGGVDLDNLSDWLKNGADMIGIGSALTKQKDPSNFEAVTQVARQYVNALKDVL